MRHFTKIVTVMVTLALASAVTAAAQQYSELGGFMDDANRLSLLYRGQEAPRYRVLANGNPYWHSMEYGSGDIFFDGRLYTGVMMNFDACSQLPLLKCENFMSIRLDPEKVDWFTMGGKKFVKIRGRKDIPDGFYQEVFKGGVTFYMHVIKNIETSFIPVNGFPIGYDDPFYNPELIEFFHYIQSYYLLNGSGNYVHIRSKSALVRQFPQQKKQIRRNFRKSDIWKQKTSLEDCAAEILKFMEK